MPETWNTWDENKINSDKLIKRISDLLEEQPPKSIADVLIAVKKVDEKCDAVPNPNSDGKYCQLLLYPSEKWNTWKQTSMSIASYNLYR